jgi:TolA-binding protein
MMNEKGRAMMPMKSLAMMLAIAFGLCLAQVCLARDSGQPMGTMSGDAAALKQCQGYEKATRGKQKRITQLKEQIEIYSNRIRQMGEQVEGTTPGIIRMQNKRNELSRDLLRTGQDLVNLIKQAEAAGCSTIAGGSYRNWLDCWNWCDRHRKKCEFCTDQKYCGEGYKRLKGWSGRGKNYYACKKKRFGFKK